jgi:glycerol-3-phosphate O-acyltransferase/dihydroxyacetone phosphate acyltransferase
VIQAARRLYKPPGRELSVGQKLELTRRFAEGYAHFINHPEVKALKDKVLEYNNMLKAYGLRDHQVIETAIEWGPALRLLATRFLTLLVMATLALPGALLNLPIALIAEHISKQKARG